MRYGVTAVFVIGAWAGGDAQAENFLHQHAVADARGQLADLLADTAEKMEADPDFADPRGRALLMAQVAASMAELLVEWEERLESDPEGRDFIEDGGTMIRCTALASMADREVQANMLRVAAGYWAMEPGLDIPADLCD